MYIYVYIYVSIYIYIYIYTYSHTHIYIYKSFRPPTSPAPNNLVCPLIPFVPTYSVHKYIYTHIYIYISISLVVIRHQESLPILSVALATTHRVKSAFVEGSVGGHDQEGVRVLGRERADGAGQSLPKE